MATLNIPVPPSRSDRAASAPSSANTLENGDRLTRAEFERRYEARPDIKKAELIEGVVHMPSPTRSASHGRPHAATITWLEAMRRPRRACRSTTTPLCASISTTGRSRTRRSSSIVALANMNGGRILLGVEDDGRFSGIRRRNLQEWLMDTVVGRHVTPHVVPDRVASRQVLPYRR